MSGQAAALSNRSAPGGLLLLIDRQHFRGVSVTRDRIKFAAMTVAYDAKLMSTQPRRTSLVRRGDDK